jgi:two-component system, cell cycle response regulator
VPNSDSLGLLVGGRPTSVGYGPVKYRDFPILLIDDDPERLDTLCKALEHEFWVIPAQSPAQALELLSRKEYAIIIAEQGMPGVSGAQVLSRTVSGWPHLIRMLITDTPVDPELTEAVNSGGIYHYIARPWARDRIALMLKRVLESYSVARSHRTLVGELKLRNEELEQMVEERTSQIREWAERQRKLAISDGLTGLYNHRHFQERWRREVKRAQRYGQSVSLMIIDVDKFKNFNDTMGHPQGDQLLRNLSLLLQRSVRDVDLVARYGGEEFVIMLPETRKDDGVILAERVRSLVAQHPFEHRDVQPGGRITVSVGVAAFPADGGSPGDVLVRADKALYKAKEGGRDRVIVARGDGPGEEDPNDEGDLALIVEEDGDTRIAAPSAMDVPVAGAIDTMRLRLRQSELQKAVEQAEEGVVVRPSDEEDDELAEEHVPPLFPDSIDEIVVEVDDFFDPSKTDDEIPPWMRGRDKD